MPLSSELPPILTTHIDVFHPFGLLGIILYGSFVRGEEREDSDVDLCLVFDELDSDKKKEVGSVSWKDQRLDFERKIDRVLVAQDKFQSEWAPIYTSIKKTGQIVWGNMDLTLSNVPYKNRYAEFYKISKEVESRKVRSAEDFFEKWESIEINYLYIASKHTIQAYLAMQGQGFTSRFDVLHKLTVEDIGAEYAEMFFYIYELQKKEIEVTKEEFAIALAYTKKILTLYERISIF
jgi:predicted nucleotidyltransferase